MNVRSAPSFLFFIGMVISSVAHAAFVDGTHLANSLAAERRVTNGTGSEQDAVDSAFANGYILGVIDTKARTVLCIPSGVKSDQLFAIVDKYVTQHPQLWNKSAEFLVLSALWDAFPCTPKS